MKAPIQLNAQDLTRIGQMSFRHWYDHQLREGYLWLAAGFAALLLALLGFELVAPPEPVANVLSKIVMAILAVVVMLVAWRRYRRSLALSQSVSTMVLCPACRYPSFAIVRVEQPGSEGEPARLGHDLNEEGLLVSCRSCHHRWRWGYAPQATDLIGAGS